MESGNNGLKAILILENETERDETQMPFFFLKLIPLLTKAEVVPFI